MVRTKVEIKKIEKASSRQVTFSKRRSGVIKKAFELCFLCDIDLALILISPSGKLSLFSGKNRVEDVLVRYVCLPEHERSQRIQNPEMNDLFIFRFLQMNLQRMKTEIDLAEQMTNPTNLQAEVKELEKEIDIFQRQLDEVEKQLSIFEGDPFKITTLQEATYREQMLQRTLLRVQMRKQVIEGNHAAPAVMTNVQPQNTYGDASSTQNANQTFQLLQQNQILELLQENGLIPVREEQQPLQQHHIPQESAVDYTMLPLGNNHFNVTDIFNGDNPTNGISMTLHPWSEHANFGTGHGTASTPIHYAMSQLRIRDPVLQKNEDELSSNHS